MYGREQRMQIVLQSHHNQARGTCSEMFKKQLYCRVLAK
jgi:hypothetical protein